MTRVTRHKLPGDYRNHPEETLRKISMEVAEQVPEEFYIQQKKIETDPMVDQLVRGNPEWKNTLAYKARPRPNPISIENYEITLDDPTNNGTVAITGKNILKVRDQQLSLIKSKLSEMTKVLELDSKFDTGNVLDQLTPKDPKGRHEMFKKLLVANPAAAGELLAMSPYEYSIFCDAYKEIDNDKDKDKWVSWGLMGAVVGSVAVTAGLASIGYGAAAAGMGTVSAGAISAAQVVFSLQQAYQSEDLARLQQVACYAKGATDDSCHQYSKNMNSAIESYIESGLALTGLVPFMGSLAKSSYGSLAKIGTQARQVKFLTHEIKEGASDFAFFLGSADYGKLLGSLSTLKKDQIQEFIENLKSMTLQQRKNFAAEIRGNSGSKACIP